MNAPTVLFVSKGTDSASTRYRALHYFPLLEEAGWQPLHLAADRHPLSRLRLLREAGRAQVVVILRKTFAAFFAHLLRRRARRLVLDLDDAIFLASNGEPSRLRMTRFARTAGLCDQVWAGNGFLAREAARHGTRVTVLPTSLDPAKYRIHVEKPEDFFDLVWIGSHSTRKYLLTALPWLEAARSRVPNLRLKVVADFALSSPTLPILCLPWSEAGEATALASAHVGIAPMVDNPWTRGKCALKILQYMAAGLPVVSSPAGVNREVVVAGENGFLAGDDPSAWSEAVARLAADETLARRLGEAGRVRVEEGFSVARTFATMRASLDALAFSPDDGRA